jgi:hypothetical protein
MSRDFLLLHYTTLIFFFLWSKYQCRLGCCLINTDRLRIVQCTLTTVAKQALILPGLTLPHQITCWPWKVWRPWERTPIILLVRTPLSRVSPFEFESAEYSLLLCQHITIIFLQVHPFPRFDPPHTTTVKFQT